jgi:hypothetical protein
MEKKTGFELKIIYLHEFISYQEIASTKSWLKEWE